MERRINKRIHKDYNSLYESLSDRNKEIFKLLQVNQDFLIQCMFSKIQKTQTNHKDISMAEPFRNWLLEDAGYSGYGYTRLEIKLLQYLSCSPKLEFFIRRNCVLSQVDISVKGLTDIDNKIWLTQYTNDPESADYFVGTTARAVITCVINLIDGWKSHLSCNVDARGVAYSTQNWFHLLKVDFSRWLHAYKGKRMECLSFQNVAIGEQIKALKSDTGNPEYDFEIASYHLGVERVLDSYKPMLPSERNTKYKREAKIMWRQFVADFMAGDNRFCTKTTGKFKMGTWFNSTYPSAGRSRYERFKKLKPLFEKNLYIVLDICLQKEILDKDAIVLFENKLSRFKDVRPVPDYSRDFTSTGALSANEEIRQKVYLKTVLYTPEEMHKFDKMCFELTFNEKRMLDAFSSNAAFQNLLETITGKKAKPYGADAGTFQISADITGSSIAKRKKPRYTSIMSVNGGYSSLSAGTEGKFNWTEYFNIKKEHGEYVKYLAWKKRTGGE